jgi:hypothetical protein
MGTLRREEYTSPYLLIHMPATLDTRKPVVKLTAADLREFSVWEYAMDEEGVGEQDETWVRPVNGNAVRKDTYSQLVATDFTTPSGRKLQGFMEVSTAEGRVEIEPGAVIGKVGYRVLPHMSRKQAIRRNADSAIEDRDRLLSALGQPEEDVFPLRYELRVPVRGEKEVRVGGIP